VLIDPEIKITGRATPNATLAQRGPAAPEDFTKSISTLGIVQVTIYTLTGAIIYAFVGQDILP
jgi:hypothetical protein